MGYARCAGPAGIVNFINGYRAVCNSLDIYRARTGCISLFVINISIINYSGVVYNVYYARMRCIIIINTRAIHVTFRSANPIVIGRIITAAY